MMKELQAELAGALGIAENRMLLAAKPALENR